MLYAFVVGSNKELSKEELSCYFETNDIKYKVVDEAKEFLIIDSEGIDPKIISDVGGTIKIGAVKPLEDIRLSGLFGISLYNAPIQSMRGIKKKILEKNRGAKLFRTDKKELTAVEIMKKDLIGKEILVMRSKKAYYAVTQSVYDPFEYKKLDLQRPRQRGMLSMPIRLSKIMINLAKLRRGDSMLDPFCGYGTILQAGLLSGMNVHGSDSDRACVDSAKENIDWLKGEYRVAGEYMLKVADVMDADKTTERFDAIVTESYLGPPLRKSVTEEEAQNLIDDLNVFYSKVLEKLGSLLNKGKRIVITLPVIKTKAKEFSMDIDPKGLKLIKRIRDVQPKHITGREIFIFEK